MEKNPYILKHNGRAAFYAQAWPEINRIAVACGWELGLHGSLQHDLDFMAMPWIENHTSPDFMILEIAKLFYSEETIPLKIIKNTWSKPNHRVVYTILIIDDIYLDINIIDPDAVQQFNFQATE